MQFRSVIFLAKYFCKLVKIESQKPGLSKYERMINVD